MWIPWHGGDEGICRRRLHRYADDREASIGRPIHHMHSPPIFLFAFIDLKVYTHIIAASQPASHHNPSSLSGIRMRHEQQPPLAIQGISPESGARPAAPNRGRREAARPLPAHLPPVVVLLPSVPSVFRQRAGQQDVDRPHGFEAPRISSFTATASARCGMQAASIELQAKAGAELAWVTSNVPAAESPSAKAEVPTGAAMDVGGGKMCQSAKKNEVSMKNNKQKSENFCRVFENRGREPNGGGGKESWPRGRPIRGRSRRVVHHHRLNRLVFLDRRARLCVGWYQKGHRGADGGGDGLRQKT